MHHLDRAVDRISRSLDNLQAEFPAISRGQFCSKSLSGSTDLGLITSSHEVQVRILGGGWGFAGGHQGKG